MVAITTPGGGGGTTAPGSPFNSGNQYPFLNYNPLATQQPGQSLMDFLNTRSVNGMPPADSLPLPQTQYTPAGSGYDFPAGPPDAGPPGTVIPGDGIPVSQGPSSPDNPGQDIMNGLYSQLAALGAGPSVGDLTKQANQQASLKYDPLIQQLQQNLGMAKTNEAQASTQIGGLYNSLGKALAAQMPVITNQFNQQEDQSRQNYATLQNQIQSNYQNAQAAQEAELQKLGIQAALPQSTQQMQSDEQYLKNQAGTNGQALNDAMRLEGQGQADFMQRASAIAPTQGANLQASLAQQLLQLENSINQQIAGYRGQEGAAAQSILAQLQNQASGSLNKQQSDLIDQTMKMAELEKLTNPGIFGTAPKAPSATKYKGISGVPQYFQDNASLNDPGALENIFQTFATSPDYAKLSGPGGIGSPTLETAWPLLQQDAMSMIPGIPQSALEELYNALAIKLGKFQ